MKHRIRQTVMSGLKTWMIVYLISGLVLFAAAWRSWNQNSKQRIALNAAQLQYAPLERLEQELVQIRSETDSMQKRERLVLELSENRSMVALLGRLSIVANDCHGKININDFLLTAESNQDETYTKLTLSGVGVNDVAIAQFVAELRDCEMFTTVQLTSSGTSKTGEKLAKVYALECTF